jgi:hypothetical protein
VGGTLFDHYGFRGTTDILMIVSIILSFIYYLVNIRPILNKEYSSNDEEGIIVASNSKSFEKIKNQYKYAELQDSDQHED